MNKKGVLCAGLFVWFLLCLWLANHLGVNASDSVKFRIYWHTAIKGGIKRNGYYVIDYQGSEYQGLIVKRVGCLPADNLIRIGDDFTCNGALIAKAVITENEKGEPYPRFDPDEHIQGYFVLGDSIRSYDSRCFGLLPETAFKREVKPLW